MTPAASVNVANKARKGYAKERPPIPTNISLAYGAPGRVAMPPRLKPKPKNTDVAEAIQEMLDEDQSAQQTSPFAVAQSKPERSTPDLSELSDDQLSSDLEDENPEEEQKADDKDEADVQKEDVESKRDEDESQDENQGKDRDEGEEHVKVRAGASRSTRLPERQDFAGEPRSQHRSFATEAIIASEARLRRPANPLRETIRYLTNFLVGKWDDYGGPLILEYLTLLFKFFFIASVVIFSYQGLQPYMPNIRLPSLSSLRSPLSAGISANGKSVFDNRPLTALQEMTTYQYNLLRARLDSLELSYDRLSRTVSAPVSARKINFFALGSGVIVDPFLTSPTRYDKSPSVIDGMLSWLRGLPPAPFPPPFMALTAWDDMGDCWCAPDSGGKSQLAITLQKWVVPQELVVEHIPMEATLDSGAAPKDIELWVQILDPDRREAVARAALSHNITSPDIENQREIYSTSRSLDRTWVRIGRWQYNLFSPDNVQVFQVPVPLEHFGAPIQKLAIRTLSNWGKVDYVCLYRLKLHGLIAKAVVA
ncbi:MAG: hypothetical protein LQ340_006279 [Diploschistes diacapsis]|nr:MAG: hypothetical protein LQ340_006279 [Diploschistes diacapsis]